MSDELKRARRIAKRCAEEIITASGCHAFVVVAERDDGRLRTALAEDRALEIDASLESAVLLSALSRIVSLLVLQSGKGDAFAAVLHAFREGLRLADEAQSHCESL